MQKRLIVLLATCILPVAAAAQQSTPPAPKQPTIAELQERIDELTINLNRAIVANAACQAQLQLTGNAAQLNAETNALIVKLEKAHPGKHWDNSQGQLIDNQKPAPAPQPAPPAPAKN